MPSRHPDFPSVKVFDHPLIQHKLTRLRDRATGSSEFRALLNEIAGLMTFEICRELTVEPHTVETPVATAHGVRLRDKVRSEERRVGKECV